LCYKDIDEIAFDKLVFQYYQDEKKKLSHLDRNHFVQSKFIEDEQCLKRQLDDLFKFDLNDENFKKNSLESIELLKEKILYEIEFKDGSSDKFDSSKGIFLIEGNEQINTTIGEVYEGATIRFYQNNNPKGFRKILKIFDTENLLEKFDKFSNSWKSSLQKLLSIYEDIDELHTVMFRDGSRVEISTFRNYFDGNCITRFPRKKTLDAIKRLCIKNDLHKELIVSKFDEFIVYSRKDHSIRQQAGKIIGNDLIEYEAYGEKSDALTKLSATILEELLQTVQTKIIKKKKLLEDE
jgi:hypothetical protein